MIQTISCEILVAYSQCQRKAYLLLNSAASGAPHEYVQICEEQAHINRIRYLDTIKQKNPGLSAWQANDSACGEEIALGTQFKFQDLEASCDLLKKVQGSRARNNFSYEPVMIAGGHHISKEQKLALSFTGFVLGQLQGRLPERGHIVTADGQNHSVDLTSSYKIVGRFIELLRQWTRAGLPEAPSVILNKHCPYCQFRNACVDKAEQADHISLLDGISTPKAVQKYEKLGIFTVRQLSYLYKPRRRKKRGKMPSHTHKPELQALAIRTGKVHVLELPELVRKPVELFVDIEGVPDLGFYYLIGLLVCGQGPDTFYSFWADRTQDESRMWQNFMETVCQYSEAPLYHYGRYDQNALNRLSERYETHCDFQGRLINLTNYIYGKIYFPCRSNGLKEIGRFISASWSSPEASGLQSLVWRHHWDASHDLVYKDLLVTYNREDCQALKLLTDELSRIRAAAHTSPDVDFIDKPKRHATDAGQRIHEQLEMILEFAHERYDERKIKFRRDEPVYETAKETTKEPVKPGVKKGYLGQRKMRPKANKVVWLPRGTNCPKDGEKLRSSRRTARRLIIDLVLTKSGMKKTITEYVGYQGYCTRCNRYYSPPSIRQFGANQLYGHGFQSWIVYQRVALRMTYGAIAEAMREQFNEKEPGETIAPFIRNLSHYYADTEKRIIRCLLEFPFIHNDDTSINVRGANQYVWTFTNDKHVIFRLTKTREATIVHEFLAQYTGVLISDFYPGYDSVPCRQQKCWVHLIRDLNNDLWENPFDAEYEQFVAEVRGLIIPVMGAVHQYGLKKRHLYKFMKQVDIFYKKVIVDSNYKSEVVLKYQKRFIKYRTSLFTFLELDGIPWHNNTAERALRHVTKQQQVSGIFQEALTPDYLRLLGIKQTCRFQGKSFLKFLFSKEIDLDQFK